MTPLPANFLGFVSPIAVGILAVAAISLLRELARQKFSAIFVAGAGAAYLAGGFGLWELAFCAVVTVLAYRGVTDYRAIGVAWLLHSGWDIAHHLWGNPILPFAPDSSFGCAICDPVLAIWYFFGAPDLWRWLRSRS